MMLFFLKNIENLKIEKKNLKLNQKKIKIFFIKIIKLKI